MSTVDWSKVKTERQEEEGAIRRRAEDLAVRLDGISLEIVDLEESPAEMTPAVTAEALGELSRCLSLLAQLFHAHLKAVDLDDTAKAIGISGGHLSPADIASHKADA